MWEHFCSGYGRDVSCGEGKIPVEGFSRALVSLSLIYYTSHHSSLFHYFTLKF